MESEGRFESSVAIGMLNETGCKEEVRWVTMWFEWETCLSVQTQPIFLRLEKMVTCVSVQIERVQWLVQLDIESDQTLLRPFVFLTCSVLFFPCFSIPHPSTPIQAFTPHKHNHVSTVEHNHPGTLMCHPPLRCISTAAATTSTVEPEPTDPIYSSPL